jgi:hypothetical protein
MLLCESATSSRGDRNFKLVCSTSNHNTNLRHLSMHFSQMSSSIEVTKISCESAHNYFPTFFLLISKFDQDSSDRLKNDLCNYYLFQTMHDTTLRTISVAAASTSNSAGIDSSNE